MFSQNYIVKINVYMIYNYGHKTGYKGLVKKEVDCFC